ncbi:MAG: hypothetical protein CMQ58_01475 [Gammaproteobacteria bacterium]|nr:hypothetical protein [Gammaproteobacteria bacterium]
MFGESQGQEVNDQKRSNTEQNTMRLQQQRRLQQRRRPLLLLKLLCKRRQERESPTLQSHTMHGGEANDLRTK